MDMEDIKIRIRHKMGLWIRKEDLF
ncbi:hypothetical protein PanWU01x14_267280 [Parasponia andersonii]|uniref:Uncharacterized protein n=1 Tax=Parasponia andersonii TaxID=3476 RepID=A0A2P5B6D1_PARAD|nr:hypothetical protein PanWU01x14_267280 [Parasponia andersonii]